MNGWVKTYRKLRRWEWYKTPHMVHLFVHLLLSANHELARWKGIEIMPGQLVTGRQALSEDTGISERSVRTCLKRLKSTGEVTIETTSKFSLITIVRWADYQGSERDSTSKTAGQPSHERPATDQQLTTNEKEKNEDKEKKTVSPSGDMFADDSANRCPHQDILDLYHRLLPACPKVREWTTGRQALLRTRWKEKRERQSLEFWRNFFEWVALSDFLSGKTESVFIADLEWLIRPKNFPKVLEGKYHRQQGQPILSTSSRGITGWAERERQRLEALRNDRE